MKTLTLTLTAFLAVTAASLSAIDGSVDHDEAATEATLGLMVGDGERPLYKPLFRCSPAYVAFDELVTEQAESRRDFMGYLFVALFVTGAIFSASLLLF